MTNILIVGVGGQGTLLASKIIGETAIQAGFDVKVSEVHGMAQRGGSVVTYVRFGKNVQSPIIEDGGADIVLAFEMLEALRAARYLKKTGTMIIAQQKINPMSVVMGVAKYPDDILDRLDALNINYILFDAKAAALKAGSEKTINVAMIGKMAARLNLPRELWLDALKASVREKHLQMNTHAFELGYGG